MRCPVCHLTVAHGATLCSRRHPLGGLPRSLKIAKLARWIKQHAKSFEAKARAMGLAKGGR